MLFYQQYEFLAAEAGDPSRTDNALAHYRLVCLLCGFMVLSLIYLWQPDISRGFKIRNTAVLRLPAPCYKPDKRKTGLLKPGKVIPGQSSLSVNNSVTSRGLRLKRLR